jgi:hypothetical protein
MQVFSYLWKMLVSPRRTCQELLHEGSIRPAAAMVLVFSMLFGILNLVSYLKKDYPPDPATLKVWVDSWGEFAMLPVVKIPPESYRLFTAIIFVPLGLAIWILMAGTARLFSLLFKGKGNFDQYLKLFGFSFFLFWLIAALCDLIYSGFLDPYVVPGLQNQYGPFARGFFLYFPQLMYPVIMGLGGVYNGIAVHVLERFSLWRTILIACCTFIIPIFFIAVLIR